MKGHVSQSGHHTHDRRVSPGRQMLHKRVGKPDRAEQVGGYRRIRIREVTRPLQRLEAHDAGIVDQHVERGMGSENAVGEVSDIVRTPDVDQVTRDDDSCLRRAGSD